MSITDELRTGGIYRPASNRRYFIEEELTAIADRIDAEALSRRNEAYNMGYKAGIDMGFASADDWLADHEDAMAERGWVKLPLDADGVPICVGDELDYIKPLPPDVPARFEVQDMFYFGNGKWHLRAYPATYNPRNCRHHHEPTVEDVLKDFIDAWAEWKDGAAMMNPVETYAAKLRLSEEAE